MHEQLNAWALLLSQCNAFFRIFTSTTNEEDDIKTIHRYPSVTLCFLWLGFFFSKIGMWSLHQMQHPVYTLTRTVCESCTVRLSDMNAIKSSPFTCIHRKLYISTYSCVLSTRARDFRCLLEGLSLIFIGVFRDTACTCTLMSPIITCPGTQ